MGHWGLTLCSGQPAGEVVCCHLSSPGRQGENIASCRRDVIPQEAVKAQLWSFHSEKRLIFAQRFLVMFLQLSSYCKRGLKALFVCVSRYNSYRYYCCRPMEGLSQCLSSKLCR